MNRFFLQTLERRPLASVKLQLGPGPCGPIRLRFDLLAWLNQARYVIVG